MKIFRLEMVPLILARVLLAGCMAENGVGFAFPQDANNTPKSDLKKEIKTPVAEVEIRELVRQLDHNQPAKREEAQAKLLIAGKVAVPELTKAAQSDKKVVGEKAIAILGQLSESDDKATKEAALSALKTLAKNKDPILAEKAKRALNEDDPEVSNPFGPRGIARPPFFMNQGNGVGDQIASVSNFNGKRKISVKQGEVETNIQDLDGGKIWVRVTGGGKKVDLKVKNLEELKVKQPEAHALYLQYGSNSKSPLGAFGVNPNGRMNGPDNHFNNTMIKQLEQLKGQFKNDPVMLQMIDDQIKRIQGK